MHFISKKYNKKYAIILITKQKDIIFYNKNQFLNVLRQFEFEFFPKTPSSHISLIYHSVKRFIILFSGARRIFKFLLQKYPLLRNKM